MRDNTYQNMTQTIFLNTISNFPQLSTEQSLEYEKDITEKELLEALKVMPNDKSPENDGLTKEFFEKFWSEVKKNIPILRLTLLWKRRTLHLTKTSNY